jgi:hypothetical protein
MQSNLPGDVTTQAKALETSLNKVGGVVPTPGAAFRRPEPEANALQSFVDLNNSYNTMVSMMQVGLDMTPTSTQIATWENDCTESNRTVDAWKQVQQQIAALNVTLAANHLEELKFTPTELADVSCTFSQPGRRSSKPSSLALSHAGGSGAVSQAGR